MLAKPSVTRTVKNKLQFLTAFVTGIVFINSGSKFQFHHLPPCISLQYRPLKVESIDRYRIGSDLTVIATETGFFTVSPLLPKKASKIKEKPFCHAVAIFLFVSGVKKSEKHRDRKGFSVVMFWAKGKNRG